MLLCSRDENDWSRFQNSLCLEQQAWRCLCRSGSRQLDWDLHCVTLEWLLPSMPLGFHSRVQEKILCLLPLLRNTSELQLTQGKTTDRTWIGLLLLYLVLFGSQEHMACSVPPKTTLVSLCGCCCCCGWNIESQNCRGRKWHQGSSSSNCLAMGRDTSH